jgi:hypothetical protein
MLLSCALFSVTLLGQVFRVLLFCFEQCCFPDLASSIPCLGSLLGVLRLVEGMLFLASLCFSVQDLLLGVVPCSSLV